MQQVASMFDPVDVIFDLPGVVAGYSVSPDSRYAVVNLRPWSTNPDLSGKHIIAMRRFDTFLAKLCADRTRCCPIP